MTGETRLGDITVRAALQLPSLRRGLPEVLVGEHDLERAVRWVHTGEVPNIASLLKGGELLLTTGLGLGVRPAEQRAFVRRLAEREIAALVVELGARFDALPSALVDTADSYGLPLIQLHREVPYVSVTEEIHTQIVSRHYTRLRHADEVVRHCTETLVSGGGAPEVLTMLAEFTGNPVCLEAADGQPLHVAGAPGDTDTLRAWEGLRDTGLRLDVPGSGHGPDAVRARLVLLPASSPVQPVHRLVAERTANLLAVVLLQSRQEEMLAARGRGDFLADLAEGRVTAAEAPGQAGLLGFPPGAATDRVMPVVMRLPSQLPTSGELGVLARALRQELSEGPGPGVPVLLGVRPLEGRVPLLVGLRDGSERAAVADRVAAALRAGVVRAGLDRPSGPGPKVVVGSLSDWDAAGAGLRHAAEAAEAARGLPDVPWYDARDLDVELLLWRIREREQDSLADFVDRAVGPLLSHDRAARHPLLPTLERYLEHACRKSETARAMGVNRQTLYDRLARITRLLGVDLDDQQATLGLRLALRARRHTGS